MFVLALASVAHWLEHLPIKEQLRVDSQPGHILDCGSHLDQARARVTPGPDVHDSLSWHGSLVWKQRKATDRCFSRTDVSLSPFLSPFPSSLKKENENVLR